MAPWQFYLDAFKDDLKLDDGVALSWIWGVAEREMALDKVDLQLFVSFVLSGLLEEGAVPISSPYSEKPLEALFPSGFESEAYIDETINRWIVLNKCSPDLEHDWLGFV